MPKSLAISNPILLAKLKRGDSSHCDFQWRSATSKLRNVPVTPTPSFFPKVLPYKWEAYCRIHGRRIAGFPFLRSLEARNVRRYEWRAYCRANWRCTAVLFRQVVGVGLPKHCPQNARCDCDVRFRRPPDYSSNLCLPKTFVI